MEKGSFCWFHFSTFSCTLPNKGPTPITFRNMFTHFVLLLQVLLSALVLELEAVAIKVNILLWFERPRLQQHQVRTWIDFSAYIHFPPVLFNRHSPLTMIKKKKIHQQSNRDISRPSDVVPRPPKRMLWKWVLDAIYYSPTTARRHFCLVVHFFSKVLFFVLSLSPSFRPLTYSLDTFPGLGRGQSLLLHSATGPASFFMSRSMVVLHLHTHMVNDKRYMLRVWDNSCCPLAGCPV